MLPDLDNLYKPYARDADLKTSIMYWTKEAQNLGLSNEIRDAAISEAFLEMANGKTFPIGSCDCGCEFPVEWSCVALNHYVLKKMVKLKEKVDTQTAEIIKKNIHTSMLTIIRTKNDEFIAEQKKQDKQSEQPKQTEQFDLFKWIGAKVKWHWTT